MCGPFRPVPNVEHRLQLARPPLAVSSRAVRIWLEPFRTFAALGALGRQDSFRVEPRDAAATP